MAGFFELFLRDNTSTIWRRPAMKCPACCSEIDDDELPEGALVSDATTLSWLGLTDKGWFCEEPHYKGRLLHLRHKVFQAKDVIVFVHGFIGDYVNTWGKPSVLLEDPRFNRNYDFVFYGFKT